MSKAPANKKFATKTGKRDPNVRRKVVSQRDKQNRSWRAIGADLGIAPRTVRAIYDEVKGAGAHFESRPLPGGRTRKVA